MGELIHLANTQFTCKKGELRLHGDRGSMQYPAGKREIARKTGILPYTCRYIRSSITCPIGTTVVDVKRSFAAGKFDVECLGNPKLGASGLGETGTDSAGDESSEVEP